MATNKNTKKMVKKVTKPAFIVNMTNVKSVADAFAAVTNAKVDANKSIRAEQFVTALNLLVDDLKLDYYMLPKCNTNVYRDTEAKIVVKKPNVFKRFWNWITRKK